MDTPTLELIKAECEKIENSSGFGQVLIIIQDGKIHHIKPTQSIFVPSNLTKKVVSVTN